jgi:hypothetical protein
VSQSVQLELVLQGSKPQLISVQSQVVHDPTDGPWLVPVSQAPLEAHHPQPMRDAQSMHVPADWQGSTGPVPHCEGAYSQSAQLPAEGPTAFPSEQASFSPHQPHPESAVHSRQERLSLHD